MKKIYSQELKDEIIKYYLEGFGLKDVTKKFKISFKKAGEILRQAEVIRPKSIFKRTESNSITLDIEFFKDINTPDKAYWLGYIVADGTIQKDGYKMSLCSKDEEIIYNFKQAVKSGHAVTNISSFDKRTNKTYTRFMIQICSKEFVNMLIQNGVTSNKSFYCTIPELNNELFFHFCRGLFDGDGCISKKKGLNTYRIQFIATLDLLTYIQNRIEALLNVKAHPKYLLSKTYPMYSTSYFKDSEIILENLYKNSNSTNRLSRKYEKFIQFKNESVVRLR